ncbi:TatD family hydrolase [Paracidobacterium acidisoli]|uniref:TatD family deoxyribonuclease n=1 Tax=Paracidobacterium acidisoli TaxID=2303751 RepID=A0A372IUD8_9BACT|nr:TatD family hydrolase [Paracidobacterium acidisoli]MBT9329446.1 TatD family hydrolase [Paracidobacterium acidisoli]
MIDSHAHLDSDRYNEDRDALLARAYEAGVQAVLSIGIGEGPETMHLALDLARQYAGRPGMPCLYASAGIHPNEAHRADETAYARLDELLAAPEVIACGEIGIDYYYAEPAPETQKTVFSQQMEIAAAHKKPIVIHCRQKEGNMQAWDDTLLMLEGEWRRTGLGGILHCFSGSVEHARQAMEMDFLISFAGNITFPKAQPLRDVAAVLPLERMLIETDAPFLAPVPNRGKRNEPAWVKEVAVKVGEVKGVAPEEVDLRTTENFYSLFGIPKGS